MPSCDDELLPGTYGYRYLQRELPEDLPRLSVIGRQRKERGERYVWDGLDREDTGTALFQWTISGWGAFAANGRTWRLGAGSGFLAVIPSAHRYWLPEESPGWEFMFVMLAGGQATAHFRALAERLGPVATFPASSSVIRCLVALYDEVRRNPDLDEFSASEHAYRFLMHLYRHAAASDAAVPPPERVSAILSWLRTHATEPITLDHIAEASGISKYHLVRLLKRHTGLTPAQHVTRIRVERAAELLRHASLTVQEIAERVGYPSGNYLIKVFRRVVGVTPGQYRDSAGIERIDFLRVR